MSNTLFEEADGWIPGGGREEGHNEGGWVELGRSVLSPELGR